MALSADIISQFVKATNDHDKTSKASTVYGTAKIVNGKVYVKIDGSDQLTPVTTVTNVVEGERVTVQIKDHTATATGNITSPAARGQEVVEVSNKLGNFQTVTTVNFEAVNAEVTRIEGAQAEFRLVVADRFESDEVNIRNLVAKDVEIENKLTADEADIKDLKADNAVVQNAVIKDLTAEDGTVKNLNVKYANIDFTNIGQAAFDYFYSKSGLIEELVIGDGTVVKNLVGVTIKGDLIEGNTIKADKLVVLGSDGLYYKLNFEAGNFASSEEVPTDSLHGSIITAKSITAEKVSVHDLVAFGATIGGFNITSDSIYSEVKDEEGNITRGIYLSSDGQMNIGDATNYIKFVQNEDGTYSLAISAADISYVLNGSQHSISDLGKIGEYVDIGTYEDEPCILLGESDSDFKLIITNTRILFMQGSTIPAYISNQSLYVKKAVVEEELRLGQFVWQVRANGNMGLVWQDVVEEVAD